jgi:acyl carrier protein
MTTTQERVQKTVREHLGIDEPLNENTKFSEDLSLDSLDVVELVMAIEDEFEVEIDDDETTSVLTISDAVRLIDSKLEKKASR